VPNAIGNHDLVSQQHRPESDSSGSDSVHDRLVAAFALTLAAPLVLVDIGLRGESGFDVTQRLVENLPHLHSRVALISTRDPADYVDLIAATPVAGFLPKNRLSVQAILDLLG
jgi:DNA-binding NarL/FixJ family response regulator